MGVGVRVGVGEGVRGEEATTWWEVMEAGERDRGGALGDLLLSMGGGKAEFLVVALEGAAISEAVMVVARALCAQTTACIEADGALPGGVVTNNVGIDVEVVQGAALAESVLTHRASEIEHVLAALASAGDAAVVAAEVVPL